MKKKTKSWLLIAIFFTLIIRLSIFLVYSPWQNKVVNNSVFRYGADSFGYHKIAINIIENNVFSQNLFPENIRTPVYPFFIAAVYSIVGIKPWVVIFIQIIFSIITLFVLYKLCLLFASERTAIICAFLFAICPLSILFDFQILTENVFLLFFTLFLFFWFSYVKNNKYSNLIFSSLFLGISTLTRPISLYLIFGIVLLFIYEGIINKKIFPYIYHIFVFVAFFIFTLSPYIIRNKISLNTYNLSSIDGKVLLTDQVSMMVNKLYNTNHQTSRRCFRSIICKKYNVLTNNPIALASFRVNDTTNVNFELELISDNYYSQKKLPFSTISNAQELNKAQKELAINILQRHYFDYVKYSVLGSLRMLFTPPWQLTVLTFFPNVQSMKVVAAVINFDWQYLKKIGITKSFVIIALAGIQSLITFCYTIFAIIGFFMYVKRKPFDLFTISLIIIGGYFIALAGPVGIGRYKVPILPLILMLASFFISKIFFKKIVDASVQKKLCITTTTLTGRKSIILQSYLTLKL